MANLENLPLGETMEPWIIALGVGVVVTPIAIVWLILKVIRNRELNNPHPFVDENGGPPNGKIIHESATSFAGILSRGNVQIRGAGYLTLTDQELHFQRNVVPMTMRIPLTAIRALDDTKTAYLGKVTAGFIPLIVQFETPEATQDAAGFRFQDPTPWKQAIEAQSQANAN